MKKAVLAVAFAVILGMIGIAPADAQPVKRWTHHQLLTCANPSNGYRVNANLYYRMNFTAPDDWDITIETAVFNTNPNFNMDRFWLDLEYRPNQWQAIVHYGGDGTPQNTVATDWIVDNKLGAITNDSDSPAWRMSAWGVGSGSSTYFCNDYGTVF